MKKIFQLFISIILLSSCSNDFLDTSPYDSISSGNMWNSESKADQGVAGVYNALKSRTIADGYKIFDGLGYVNSYGSHGNADNEVMVYLNGNITPSHSLFSDTWKQHYEGIHRANDAIQNLHKANLPTEKLERLMCEAKFLRAYFYYRLNALFKGVPIYTEPTIQEQMTKGQSSVDEVYQRCIDDLTDCINNPHFPDNTLDKSIYGRASKGAAYALRGMVYMWKKDYPSAIADLSKVESCGYGLWAGEWSEFFKYENEKDKEMIFPLQYEGVSGFSSNIQKFIGGRSHYDGWGEALPNSEYVDMFLNADGSEFIWEDRLPGWNSLTVTQREVFFLRDGLSDSSSDKKVVSAYNSAVQRLGSTTMSDYYLPSGNEARIKAAFEDRDPRLTKSVFTPYSSAICYNPYWNGGNEHELTLRWPLFDNVAPYWDMWNDKRNTAFYMYKKYNETRKGRYVNRDLCHVDLPLIRFTDVVLLLSEAYNENNQLDKSIAEFNKVRTRNGVNMPSLTEGGSGPNAVQGKEDMKRRIQYERRAELALEGINYFDELRWGTLKESKYNGGNSGGRKSWWGSINAEYRWEGDHFLTWPAPTKETQMNPNIKQTPGWAY